MNASDRDKIWAFAGSIVTRCHTVLMRGRFASWGDNSCIEKPAKLNSPRLVFVGSNVYICEHAWLNANDDLGDGMPTLHIGDGTYIGRFAHINAWRSVTLGSNVLIADRVFISDSSHRYADTDIPIRLQGDSFIAPVTLRDGCWIGAGAVILPGVTVGRNAVVGANAVVTRDIPDNAVVAGIPAEIIRRLDQCTMQRPTAQPR